MKPVAPLEILYEDNHLIAVNKRAGDLVQGDKTGDPILPDAIREYIRVTYDKPGNVFLGVVHRLDRPTTGAVVFARTSKALTRLNQSFKEGSPFKTYWALVENRPGEDHGRLEHYLVKNPKTNKTRAFPGPVEGGRKAILSYRYRGSLDHFHLLEIDLVTGRSHQIRAQLAAEGCIIKGDLKYGARRSNPDGSICLHALRLRIPHPTREEEVDILAPLPPLAIWKACRQWLPDAQSSE